MSFDAISDVRFEKNFYKLKRSDLIQAHLSNNCQEYEHFICKLLPTQPDKILYYIFLMFCNSNIS